MTGETRVLVEGYGLSVVAAEFGGVSTNDVGVLIVLHGAGVGIGVGVGDGDGDGVGVAGGAPVVLVVQPGGSAGGVTLSKFSL